MNTDKVLALAREADGMVLANQTVFYHANLIKFAALIQREMEAENAELRDVIEQMRQAAIQNDWHYFDVAIDRARSANDKG